LKHSFIALPLLFASLGALSQDQGGTIVVLIFSQNAMVIAADSRTSLGHGTYDDSGCKIAELKGKYVVAGTGRAGYKGGWDAIAVAQQLRNKDSVKNIATNWAKELAALNSRDAQAGKVNPENLARGSIYSAIVAGFEGGEPILYKADVVKVLAKHGPPSYRADVGLLPIQDGKMLPLGTTDIAKEFIDQKTPRSKQWGSEFDLTKPWNDIMVPMARKVIALTAQYSTDKGRVGGETDVIQVDALGVHWLARKKLCRD
jgi:hypothetical protein